MIKYNYHTHTCFCDGTEDPKAYLQKAASLGFLQLGYSAHAEVPFDNKWSLRPNDTPRYVKQINRLKDNNFGIDVLIGLEADYIPKTTTSFQLLKKTYNLDYIIGSVHLVKPIKSEHLWFIDGPSEGYDEGIKVLFENNAQVAVKQYFHQLMEMIDAQNFDIIGHLDKVKMNNKSRFFSTSEKWYMDLVMETLRLIKEKDIIMEVNTRGLYKGKCTEFFPSKEIVKMACQMKIPILISSDAHQPGELNLLFEEAKIMINQQGYHEIMMFNNRNWQSQAINECQHLNKE